MFCKKCGCKNADSSVFCCACGAKLTDESDNRKFYKCPNCGEPAKAFERKCSLCDFEFRNISSTLSLSDFQQKLEKMNKKEVSSVYNPSIRVLRNEREGSQASEKSSKIDLISSFPIPNTKEDILEFMFLASSNFDSYYYLTHLNEEDCSDAWLSKIKQCYQKARLVFGNDPEFEQVEKIYKDTMSKIGQMTSKEEEKKVRNKKLFWGIGIAIVAIILILIIN